MSLFFRLLDNLELFDNIKKFLDLKFNYIKGYNLRDNFLLHILTMYEYSLIDNSQVEVILKVSYKIVKYI